jgi:hypothetical protein
MRSIGKLALSVTVRVGLLRLARGIAADFGIPRSQVLDLARLVLTDDPELLADLNADDLRSVDSR